MSVATKITDLRNWKFTIDQTQYGMNAGWARADYDDSGWSDVQSNTSWETYDYAMADYEGHGWYRTRYAGIRKAGRRHILKFNGVGGVAKVFVNGKLVCTNEDRYLPFEADISSYLWDSRESVIAVLVDNSFRGESHLPGGFTTEWERIKDIWFQSTRDNSLALMYRINGMPGIRHFRMVGNDRKNVSKFVKRYYGKAPADRKPE